MKETFPARRRKWIINLAAFLVIQFIFFLFHLTGWYPALRDIDGNLFGKIANSVLFTEWFTPYEVPLYNLLAAFFTIALLPPAFIGAVKDLLSQEHSNTSEN
ncbi:hypothetical protein F9U64_20345 [Gracilibacillus oryzae]|uniref:YfzA-like protein n=1 Tax=Gracilibacillus oryzae TaxID=1672701 RepID=A0A7C8KWL3_9BACI|nr:YfzA family protein [Gracilibacillus oryzae]KAB8126254.1 hypothetical protein F9U64_20345 [Gracilibacillus oryzae]